MSSSDEYIDIELDDDVKVQTKKEPGLFALGINHDSVESLVNKPLEVVAADIYRRQTSSPEIPRDPRDSTLCMVCDGPANGIHFKALSCAACNAFFRRSVAENRRYICRESGHCKISHKDRCLCRACRLKKCLKVGMDPAAVQPQRDAIGSKRKKIRTPIPRPSIEVRAQPSPDQDKDVEIDILTCDPVISNTQSILSNVSNVSNISNSVASNTYQCSDTDPASSQAFTEEPTIVMGCTYGNLIEEGLLAYHQLCERRRLLACPRTLKDLFGGTIPTFTKCEAIFARTYKSEADSAFIVEFLKSLQPFSMLSVEDQVLLCRSFCLPMNVIEKYYTTYKQGGHLTERIYHQNYQYIDINEVANAPVNESDGAGSSADMMINPKAVFKMNLPYLRQALRDIVVPMAELEMTDVEAIGMMLIMLFNPHIPEMSEATRKSVKATRDRVFEDWHSIYVHNDIPNGPEKVGNVILLTSTINEFAKLLPQCFHFIRVFGMVDYDELFNDVF
uniref:Nuclear receptor domain-containing protein n=1 Tax=Panagrellus redivivus TaxID=6233 RepID=A0A7E4V8U0_PANRE